MEGRPNLVARLAGGSDGPALCLLGHVDTVLADPVDWQVDPWSGELRDGCVWGRGAVDMKSQVAAEVAAAIALAEEGWRPEAGELKLVLTADEEAGAEFGAKWLCEQHPDKVRADLVVNEGAGEVFEYEGRRIYGVCVAEKGVFRFTLSTHGPRRPRLDSRASATTRSSSWRPSSRRWRARRSVPEHSPEPEAFLDALGVEGDDLAAALEEVEAQRSDDRGPAGAACWA